MDIKEKTVVSLSYELRLDNEKGEVVERVDDNNPLVFIYGIGSMLPKFEENLAGMKSGEEFKFGLESQDAYGPVVDNAIVDVPKDIFVVDGQIDENILKVGNMVPMMDNSGNRLNGLVVSIGDSAVKMDFNHPMAGKNLHFSGKIAEVREATDEEISHGHVHGGQGCDGDSCNSNDDKNGCGCGC